MQVEEAIGRRIKAERERNEQSLAGLGGTLETYLGKPWSAQGVWQAERGRRDFKASHLVAFALALNVPLASLIVAPEGEPMSLGGHYNMTADDAMRLFSPGGSPEIKPTLERLFERLNELDADFVDTAEQIRITSKNVSGAADIVAALLRSSDRPQAAAAPNEHHEEGEAGGTD